MTPGREKQESVGEPVSLTYVVSSCNDRRCWVYTQTRDLRTEEASQIFLFSWPALGQTVTSECSQVLNKATLLQVLLVNPTILLLLGRPNFFLTKWIKALYATKSHVLPDHLCQAQHLMQSKCINRKHRKLCCKAWLQVCRTTFSKVQLASKLGQAADGLSSVVLEISKDDNSTAFLHNLSEFWTTLIVEHSYFSLCPFRIPSLLPQSKEYLKSRLFF